MFPILVSGGSYPDNWKSIQDEHDENFIRFHKAQLWLLDWDSGDLIREVVYQSPEEYRNPSMMFKVGERTENEIRVVSNSEVVILNKQLDVDKVFSHPSFNDLHSVTKHNGNYYVVNTGLEILQIMSEEGELIEEINIAETPTWERFDKSVDYRKIGSTKPHQTHFNHVFTLKDEVFVTKLVQKLAYSITDPEKVFDIEVGNPHDGVVKDDKVYFTTTNGHVIIFDANTRKKISVININELLEQANEKSGGWCRGILPLDNGKILVGFTELRHTKFKEFISWAKNLGDKPAPSRIIEIDLDLSKVTRVVNMPGKEGSAIFSIMGMAQ